jgi:hypothetical protein
MGKVLGSWINTDLGCGLFMIGLGIFLLWFNAKSPYSGIFKEIRNFRTKAISIFLILCGIYLLMHHLYYLL